MYLAKEYTEEQINKMDCNDVNTLLNRYESVLSARVLHGLVPLINIQKLHF